MRESDLIERVADRTGRQQKEVKRIIRALALEIAECVAHGDKVPIQHFGSFFPRDLPAKQKFINGAFQDIPAKRAPKFRPFRAFRDHCQETAKRLNHL